MSFLPRHLHQARGFHLSTGRLGRAGSSSGRFGWAIWIGDDLTNIYFWYKNAMLDQLYPLPDLLELEMDPARNFRYNGGMRRFGGRT